MATSKRNMRLDDEIWEAVAHRAEEIANLGVPGDRFPQFRFNVTDIIHRELARVADETIEETMRRYGIADPRKVAR